MILCFGMDLECEFTAILIALDKENLFYFTEFNGQVRVIQCKALYNL